jgi:hypothetical protein
MKSLIEQARTCHGEHTTHGKFIQDLADYAEAAKRDAEEAEAYAAELEAAFSNMSREYAKRGDRIKELESKLTMSDLMDRFIAAADALADKADRVAGCETVTEKEWGDYIAAITEYRAAREAITRGTPPAFATSA